MDTMTLTTVVNKSPKCKARKIGNMQNKKGKQKQQTEIGNKQSALNNNAQIENPHQTRSRQVKQKNDSENDGSSLKFRESVPRRVPEQAFDLANSQYFNSGAESNEAADGDGILVTVHAPEGDEFGEENQMDDYSSAENDYDEFDLTEDDAEGMAENSGSDSHPQGGEDNREVIFI